MKKKKAFFGMIIAGTAIVILFLLFGRKEEVIQYETRPTVVTEQPQNGDITLYTDLTGLIEPASKAAVLPKINGEVLEVYFQAGDMVEAGQVLCRIDSDALTTLKLNVDAAAVTLSEADRNLSRAQALYAGGTMSQQSFEQAQDAASNARIAYESAKNQYELQSEYTTVTAPIAGVVEARNIDAHDFVTTSTEICTISGQEQTEVHFGATERILENLSVGDKIQVSKNGTEHEGTVSEISSMVNSSTGLYDVKAYISDAKGLATGTRVELTVVMSHAENVLTIPLAAVNYEDSIPFIYCYENGTAAKREFEAGIYDNSRMEVISGINKDSQVITSWSNELTDGAEVLLEEAQSQADGEKAGE